MVHCALFYGVPTIIIDHVALAKQGDYRFGSICPSVCLSMDTFTAELSAAKGNYLQVSSKENHYQYVDFACVSVIVSRMWLIGF